MVLLLLDCHWLAEAVYEVVGECYDLFGDGKSQDFKEVGTLLALLLLLSMIGKYMSKQTLGNISDPVIGMVSGEEKHLLGEF